MAGGVRSPATVGARLLASGHTADAIGALSSAVQDSSYATPYKAYLALGSAYEKSGDIRNAVSPTVMRLSTRATPTRRGRSEASEACFMRLGSSRRCRRGVSHRP